MNIPDLMKLIAEQHQDEIDGFPDPSYDQAVEMKARWERICLMNLGSTGLNDTDFVITLATAKLVVKAKQTHPEVFI
jgi:hypothetical protein